MRIVEGSKIEENRDLNVAAHKRKGNWKGKKMFPRYCQYPM